MLVVAYVAEEVLVGLLKGKSLAHSAPELGGGTAAEILAIAVIMCVALIPFFALRRVYGDAEFDSLVFRGRGVPNGRLAAQVDRTTAKEPA